MKICLTCLSLGIAGAEPISIPKASSSVLEIGE